MKKLKIERAIVSVSDKRKLDVLSDYFTKNKSEKFDKYTDTLLYLAARNEHIKYKISEK